MRENDREEGLREEERMNGEELEKEF